MNLPFGNDPAMNVLTLRGHSYSVRFWSAEEWGRLDPRERPSGVVSFGFGWAELRPIDGAPPYPPSGPAEKAV